MTAKNNNSLTLGLFAAAAVTVGLAFLTSPGSKEPPIYQDQGEEFFPGFQDPTVPRALEVISFDGETASVQPFRVEYKDSRWSIPSHHFYPADAKDQMASAAALVVGLRKQSVRSDLTEDHAEYGVLDPRDPGTATEGRGVLVRFEDAGGNAMAELIIGKEVEGRAGQRYVRLPEKKRTYTTDIEKVPSTRFADWIDTELLGITAFDIQRLTFDNYSIDEVSGVKTTGEVLLAQKDGVDWTLDGLGENEEVDTARLGDVASALGNLKIVGVRPKPPGLTRSLGQAEGIELNAENVYSLRSAGFFFAQDGRLYSNEGDLLAMTKNGVVCTLRFGEILYGQGDAVTAGVSGDPNQPSAEESEAQGANRYLMVTANFDAGLIKAPEEEPLDEEALNRRREARAGIERLMGAIEDHTMKHEALPETLAALTEGEEPALATLEKDPWGNDFVLKVTDGDFVVMSLGADGEGAGEGPAHDIASDDFAYEDGLEAVAREYTDYQQKLEDGKAEVARLSERFAPWYYVIDDASFQKLRLSRAGVVTVKPVEEPPVPEDAGDGGDAGDAGDGGAPPPVLPTTGDGSKDG